MNSKGKVIYENYATPIEGLPFIFIHVPKTGGTSIRRALESFGYPTATCHQSVAAYIKRNGPEIFTKLEGHAVIRNPFDRLVSSYYFGRSRGPKWPEHRAAAFRQTNSFREFVQYLDSNYSKAGRLLIVKRQTDYVCDLDGNIPVRLWLTDNLNGLWWHMLCGLNVKGRATLNQHNRSDHPDWTDCYTKETRGIVERIYADDFELYENLKTMDLESALLTLPA